MILSSWHLAKLANPSIAYAHMLNHLAPSASLTFFRSTIAFSLFVRNLSVIFGISLSFEDHVNSFCKSIFLELRGISRIRHLLFVASTKQLMSAFVLSRFIYCNSLFLDLPGRQRAQNNATRIVFYKPTMPSASS